MNRDRLWFKPVSSNMAHVSVLGESLCEFDFLAQRYSVTQAVFKDELPVSVTLAELEGIVSSSISHIPFEQLSKSLTVWSDFELGYTVIPCLYQIFIDYIFLVFFSLQSIVYAVHSKGIYKFVAI